MISIDNNKIKNKQTLKKCFSAMSKETKKQIKKNTKEVIINKILTPIWYLIIFSIIILVIKNIMQALSVLEYDPKKALIIFLKTIIPSILFFLTINIVYKNSKIIKAHLNLRKLPLSKEDCQTLHIKTLGDYTKYMDLHLRYLKSGFKFEYIKIPDSINNEIANMFKINNYNLEIVNNKYKLEFTDQYHYEVSLINDDESILIKKQSADKIPIEECFNGNLFNHLK